MSLLASASGRADVSLEESQKFCADLTRAQARNFYYGLKLLPERKRQAMFALYAYMRLVDDIADGEDGHTVQQRLEALGAWNESTTTALAGGAPQDGHLVWPAFCAMVSEDKVPPGVFHDAIAGQRHDLEATPINTFADLREYCFRVAGVVGVASIYIWGFEGGAETERLAVDRGIAFQLTNILRDLREDAARGRTYIPADELRAAGISESQLRSGHSTAEFIQLMQQQIARASSYYRSSRALESRISADSRPTLTAMTQIYQGLLHKMEADPGRVLNQRVSLSTLAKIRIAWRATLSRSRD
jgi:15-cis-phytoene synthase